MSNPLKELHCYLRVSSEGQKTDGGSLNVQRNHGKKLSKKLGLKYVEVFEGSSSTMIRSEEDFYNSPRPQYRLLQDMVRLYSVDLSCLFVASVWYCAVGFTCINRYAKCSYL